MTSILDTYYASLAIPPPPLTKWQRIVGASSANFNTTNGPIATSTVVPNAGDLMVCGWSIFLSLATPTNVALSDTGTNSAAWTLIRPFGTFNQWGYAAWWKIATAADNNSGAGIMITATPSAGSGTCSGNAIAADTFRAPGATVSGIDLAWTNITASPNTTTTYSPSTGSSQPANTDELSWSYLALNGASSSPTYSFTGTTPLMLGSTGNHVGSEADTFYVGGVQASATAASNRWAFTWTNSLLWAIVSATFYHT